MKRAWAAVVGCVIVGAVGYGCGSDGDSEFPDGDAGTSSGASGTSGSSGTSSGSTSSSGIIGSSGTSGDAAVNQPPTPVDVVFTADNAYKFGFGTIAQVSTVEGRPSSQSAGDIFNCPLGVGPEAYTVPAESAPLDAYLYVIAWDDEQTTQGVLGQFRREQTENVIYTGDAAWEVCATGKQYDAVGVNATGPDLATINAEITGCIAGTGDKTTTSGGWVNAQGAVTAGAVGQLVVGEDNSASDGNFPITCQPSDAGPGIEAAARWMWYSPDGQNAFTNNSGNRTHSFLIFRLPARALPPPVVN